MVMSGGLHLHTGPEAWGDPAGSLRRVPETPPGPQLSGDTWPWQFPLVSVGGGRHGEASVEKLPPEARPRLHADARNAGWGVAAGGDRHPPLPDSASASAARRGPRGVPGAGVAAEDTADKAVAFAASLVAGPAGGAGAARARPRGTPGPAPPRGALRTWPAPLRLTNSRGGTRPPARACASCLGARCWCSALRGESTATVEAGQAFGRGLWSRPALEDEDVPRPGIPPCDSGRDGSLRGASVRSPVKQTHRGGT